MGKMLVPIHLALLPQRPWVYIREHISPLDISEWFNQSFVWFSLKAAPDLCDSFIIEVLKLLFL